MIAPPDNKYNVNTKYFKKGNVKNSPRTGTPLRGFLCLSTLARTQTPDRGLGG